MLERWAAFFLLFASAVHCAYEDTYSEEDCTTCCSVSTGNGFFGGGGNWLYLRPLLTPISYTREVEIASFQNLVGTSIRSRDFCFDTKFNDGFELFAFYRTEPLCDEFKWEVKVDFLAHRMKRDLQRISESPRFLQPSFGLISQESVNQFSTVDALVETDFELLNGEFGAVLDRGGPYSIRVFVGAQYADLKSNLQAIYTDAFPAITEFSANETTGVELSRFHGIGPRFGAEVRLPLFCGLSIFGDFGLNLLFSQKSGSFEQESFIGETGSAIPQSDLRLTQKFCTSQLLIPGIDGKAGLGLRLPFWDYFSLQLEGGYRGLYYWDALTHLEIFSNNAFTQSSTAFYAESPTQERSLNFGLTGWFVGGSLQF